MDSSFAYCSFFFIQANKRSLNKRRIILSIKYFIIFKIYVFVSTMQIHDVLLSISQFFFNSWARLRSVRRDNINKQNSLEKSELLDFRWRQIEAASTSRVRWVHDGNPRLGFLIHLQYLPSKPPKKEIFSNFSNFIFCILNKRFLIL